jgi:hypothetical protein
LEIVKTNAPKRQDNLLMEYEYALIKNRIDGTPVVPVYVAEKDQQDEYRPVNFGMKFPDVEHCRSKSVTDKVAFLRYVSDAKVM